MRRNSFVAIKNYTGRNAKMSKKDSKSLNIRSEFNWKTIIYSMPRGPKFYTVYPIQKRVKVIKPVFYTLLLHKHWIEQVI